MNILRTAEDWLAIEANKDLTTVNSIIRQRPFNGYIGWVGYGNLGDEAVFQALKSILPDCNFTPYRTAKPALVTTQLLKRQAPLLNVALGGGTLINQSPHWLSEIIRAVSNNVPTFCLGTGVAPQNSLDTPPNVKGNLLEEWANVLRQFIYVGVRGPLSQSYLREVGLNVEVVGDSALSLAKKQFRKRNSVKTIGINISYGTDGVMYGSPDQLLSEVQKVILSLLNKNFKIKIFPIWKDDLAASNALLKSVSNGDVEIVNAFASVNKYMEAIDDCDLFIGQKLHATVFSSMLRIPSIMLEYRPKCLDYMESIGMSSYSIRTDILTSKKLMETIDKIIEDYPGICSELDQRILFYKDLQLKKARYIKTCLRTA
jgi:polysaccharide pyruvyl transferase WcaK-like protein